MLVPDKYMAIKDDIPGFDELNKEKYVNYSDYFMSLPSGYEYEVPLSLNAETCISEYRNVEKAQASDKGNNNNNGSSQALQRG